MKNLKSLVTLVVSLATVFALGWYVRQDAEFFVIKEMPVRIAFAPTHTPIANDVKKDVLKIIKPVKQANIWKVDLSSLRGKLLQQPWVKDVVLRRVFPSKLAVQITTKEAIFLYMNRRGKIQPILSSGEVLKAIKPTLVPDVPFIKDKSLLKDSEQRQKLIGLFKQIPHKGALKLSNITNVRFEPTLGLSFKLIKEEAIVHLGERNIQTKGLQVLRVTEYLRSQKQKARVIDASFSKKVLVRLRKQT